MPSMLQGEEKPVRELKLLGFSDIRITIGRRELLAALGGTVIAWPLAARANDLRPSRRPRSGARLANTVWEWRWR
jgi:hypothetical protein